MIKTPVHAATDGLDDDDNVIYEKYVFDENGDFVCESDSPEFALEIVKRINLHDKFVEVLKSSKYALKQQYGNDSDFVNKIDELLEQCK